MLIPENVVLVGVAVLAIAAMAGALCVAWLAGRRQAQVAADAPGWAGMAVAAGPGATGTGPGAAGTQSDGDGALVPDEATIDRVTRVVSLLFIAATGAVVAISPGTTWDLMATYLLLALATLFVAFVGDLLRDRIPSARRYAIQAVGAVVFLGLLTGFTGGLASPFVVGYFVLVGGAALAWSGSGPVALALGAGLSYAFVGLVVVLDGSATAPGGLGAVSEMHLMWVLFVLLSLLLLTAIGMVAGRAQRHARDVALRLSRQDALTGLYTRGAFFAAMDREVRRVERTGRGFSLVMLDLDDLKPVNDTFGHPAGDLILRAITDVITRTIRATDLAGRYGGDEFVVLLPETDADGAFVVAEKLRREVSLLSIRVHDRAVRTSVSLGLVAYPEDGRTIEELLSAADAAMYEAKRRGKNQIVAYTTRTERVATAMGPERVPGPVPWQRSRHEEARVAEVGSARPSGRVRRSDSIGAPPSGGEEAVEDPGTPGPTAAPAAAPILQSAGQEADIRHAAPVPPVAWPDEDPLDAAAPAYPGPLPPEPPVPAPAATPAGRAPAPSATPAAASPSSPSPGPAMPPQPTPAGRVPAPPPARPASQPAPQPAPVAPRGATGPALPPVPAAGIPGVARRTGAATGPGKPPPQGPPPRA